MMVEEGEEGKGETTVFPTVPSLYPYCIPSNRGGGEREKKE